MKSLNVTIHALFPVVTGALLLLCLSGCAMIRKDADGKPPEDVVRRFVECARAKDHAGAAACWRVGDVKNIEANRSISFEKYCEYFECDTYKVKNEGMDSGIFWIGFTGWKDGKERYRRVYVDRPGEEKGGRWHLIQDRRPR